MTRRPPYSQHFPRALGSPAALVVLGLDVALGPVLQRARHVALHHVGTVAPRGKHSETPVTPRPSYSTSPQAGLPALPNTAGEVSGGAGAGGTPQLVQLLGRGHCPPCPLGTGTAVGPGGVQGGGTEQSPPVPSLLLGAQARGRQVLLVRPGWVSWLLLLVPPCTPAFTCLHPTGSESLQGSQRCPALPSPASCPPGARVLPPNNEEPFPRSGWVQASLLWVKGV